MSHPIRVELIDQVAPLAEHLVVDARATSRPSALRRGAGRGRREPSWGGRGRSAAVLGRRCRARGRRARARRRTRDRARPCRAPARGRRRLAPPAGPRRHARHRVPARVRQRRPQGRGPRQVRAARGGAGRHPSPRRAGAPRPDPGRLRSGPAQRVPADVASFAAGVSRQVRSVSSRIVHDSVSVFTRLSRELFASSEGALIDQSFALTQGGCFAVAAGPHGSQELWDVVGHQRGWEILAGGVDEPLMPFPPSPSSPAPSPARRSSWPTPPRSPARTGR